MPTTASNPSHQLPSTDHSAFMHGTIQIAFVATGAATAALLALAPAARLALLEPPGIATAALIALLTGAVACVPGALRHHRISPPPSSHTGSCGPLLRSPGPSSDTTPSSTRRTFSPSLAPPASRRHCPSPCSRSIDQRTNTHRPRQTMRKPPHNISGPPLPIGPSAAIRQPAPPLRSRTTVPRPNHRFAFEHKTVPPERDKCVNHPFRYCP